MSESIIKIKSFELAISGVNFYKYLVDRNGNVVDSFGSITKPTSNSITDQIEKLLEEKAQ